MFGSDLGACLNFNLGYPAIGFMPPENITTEATQWVRLYSGDMLRWALLRVKVRATAEDLVQETFLAACQRWPSFQGKSEVKTWLYGILRNKIADFYRKEYRLPVSGTLENLYFDETGNWAPNQIPQDWHLNEDENMLDNDAFRSVFEACKSKLPTTWHQSLHLKYMMEREGSEICQEMGISPTNYWQMLHRAKLQLRKCLEINWFRK